jgi:predicted ABC-type sugar transport system permease subunit
MKMRSERELGLDYGMSLMNTEAFWQPIIKGEF